MTNRFLPREFNLPVPPDSADQKRMNVYQRDLSLAVTDYLSLIADNIYGETSRFLPFAQGGGDAGVGSDYTTQVGHYVRVGDLVWFTMHLAWTDATHSGTGDLQINGLPYASHNLTGAQILFQGYDETANEDLVAIMQPNTKVIGKIKDDATTKSIVGSDYNLTITGTYRAL